MKPELDKLKLKIIECLKSFHQKRIEKLQTLELKTVLRRKNPYMFKAIGTQSATELVEKLLYAYISSSDETIFGDCFFEPIALAFSGGIVSDAEGVDVIIESKDRILAVAVKSGPNPFNSSAKKKQHQEFMSLRSRLTKVKKQFDALLGYAYGVKTIPATKDKIYREAGGQDFWYEMTGDQSFHVDLIKLMEEDVIINHRKEYEYEWQKVVNKYVREFTNNFCDDSGAINWEDLIKFVSERKKSSEIV